jgi:hypothetical protein
MRMDRPRPPAAEKTDRTFAGCHVDCLKAQRSFVDDMGRRRSRHACRFDAVRRPSAVVRGTQVGRGGGRSSQLAHQRGSCGKRSRPCVQRSTSRSALPAPTFRIWCTPSESDLCTAASLAVMRRKVDRAMMRKASAVLVPRRSLIFSAQTAWMGLCSIKSYPRSALLLNSSLAGTSFASASLWCSGAVSFRADSADPSAPR